MNNQLFNYYIAAHKGTLPLHRLLTDHVISHYIDMQYNQIQLFKTYSSMYTL